MIPTFAERRADLRAAGERREHGSRARYIAGCRCLSCRAANSRYETERAAARAEGDTRRLVDTARAVAHIRNLSAKGVGYKSVAAAASLSPTTVRKMLDGERINLREHTERRILAVDCEAVADGARVPASRTWSLLARLIAEGYTRTWIAAQLGSTGKRPALQLNRHFVLARSAVAVERLYRMIKAGRISR